MVVLMMGFGAGLGSGPRNPRARALRLGLVAVVLLATLLLHGHGRAYGGARVLYYVAIAGLLFVRFAGRSRRQRPPGSRLGVFGGQGPVKGAGAPPTFGGSTFGGPTYGGPTYASPAPDDRGRDRSGSGDPAGPGSADPWAPPDASVPPVDPPLGPATREP